MTTPPPTSDVATGIGSSLRPKTRLSSRSDNSAAVELARANAQRSGPTSAQTPRKPSCSVLFVSAMPTEPHRALPGASAEVTISSLPWYSAASAVPSRTKRSTRSGNIAANVAPRIVPYDCQHQVGRSQATHEAPVRQFLVTDGLHDRLHVAGSMISDVFEKRYGPTSEVVLALSMR